MSGNLWLNLIPTEPPAPITIGNAGPVHAMIAMAGDLGALPIHDDVYRLGYSLEALRDLADLGEPGVASENGVYFHEHLRKLFALIHQGFGQNPPIVDAPIVDAPLFAHQDNLFGGGQQTLALARRGEALEVGRVRHFIIQPLTATLFDPQSTPLLDRTRLPNRVLQQVIRCLSMGVDERTGSIGRIDYGNLGVVQLGAVYEGLLSWKGFFATENLIQVCSTRKQKAADGEEEEDGENADFLFHANHPHHLASLSHAAWLDTLRAWKQEHAPGYRMGGQFIKPQQFIEELSRHDRREHQEKGVSLLRLTR